METFIQKIETKKSFDQAVIAVLKAVDQKGWGLFQVYDIQERLAAKGFPLGKLKIIEICSAKYANNLLAKNILIAACMPCKIVVLEENKKVYLLEMKPSVMAEMFGNITTEDLQIVEKEIHEIIEIAK